MRQLDSLLFLLESFYVLRAKGHDELFWVGLLLFCLFQEKGEQGVLLVNNLDVQVQLFGVAIPLVQLLIQ